MNTAVMERAPLSRLVGTVLGITPAPAPNRSGKIKLDAGQMLSAFPDKLALVEIGGSYEFGCVETQKGNVTYRDVKTVKPSAPPAYANDTSNYPSHVAARRDAGQPQPQRTAPVQQQTAPQNGNGNYYKPVSPKEARRMFICSQMNALITSRQIVPLNEDTIADAISMLAKAYDMTLGQEDAAG